MPQEADEWVNYRVGMDHPAGGPCHVTVHLPTHTIEFDLKPGYTLDMSKLQAKADALDGSIRPSYTAFMAIVEECFVSRS